MRKFGNIMFCFLPALLAFGIQQLLSFPAVGIVLLKSISSSHSMDDVTLKLIRIMSGSSFTTWLSLCYGIAVLIVFAYWYSSKFRQAVTLHLSKAFNPLIIVGILLAAVGLQYVTNYVTTLTAAINPDWMNHYLSLMNSVGFDDVSPALFCYSVLIAPVCEELIFRGVTMSYAKKSMPFWTANLFQALLFGIYHMNVIQGVYAFFIGIFLGYICEKGGSIFLSILFHAAFNLWGTLAPGWFMYKYEVLIFFILWFFVGITLLSGGLKIFNRGVSQRNKRESSC